MPRVIQSLSEISAGYDAVFCDLWGCLHNGVNVFPAAVAALQAFRQAGGRVVLLTNAPRPQAAVTAQLTRLGAPDDCYDIVVTSGDAAQAAMLSGLVGRRVYHIGAAKDEPFFTDIPAEYASEPPITRVPLAEAEGVVCTGLVNDATETPDDYRTLLLEAKTRGLKLLCANPDIVVDMGEKRIYCAGALAALYTEMGGESLYFGKPHPPIYDLARQKLAAVTGRDTGDDRILVIGDGVATDIQGGVSEGLDTLFITGGLAAGEFGTDAENPDPALIDPYLTRHQLSATYAMGKLR
ncbi:MAG: TIGR01459 family HAD-type hydrolase [Paracoccaceae bacterium]